MEVLDICENHPCLLEDNTSVWIDEFFLNRRPERFLTPQSTPVASSSFETPFTLDPPTELTPLEESVPPLFVWTDVSDTEWTTANQSVLRSTSDAAAAEYEERCRAPFITWALLSTDDTGVVPSFWRGQNRARFPTTSVPLDLRHAWDDFVQALVTELGLEPHESIFFESRSFIEIDSFLKVGDPEGDSLISPPELSGMESLDHASVAINESSRSNKAAEKFLQLFKYIICIEFYYKSPIRFDICRVLAPALLTSLPQSTRSRPAVFKARVSVAAILEDRFKISMNRFFQENIFREFFIRMELDFQIVQGASGSTDDGTLVWPPAKKGQLPLDLLKGVLIRTFNQQALLLMELKLQLKQQGDRHARELKQQGDRYREEMTEMRREMNLMKKAFHDAGIPLPK